MASIQKVRNVWRAQIKIGGVRESSCFDERFQAESWAYEREMALKSIQRSLSAAHRVIKDKKRFLETSAVFSEDEIVQNSMSVEKVSGIYFLIRGEQIVYVGQSTNLYLRIEQHRREKVFDRITVLECDKKDLNSLEANYIRKFKPVLNVVGIGRKTAIDLVETGELEIV